MLSSERVTLLKHSAVMQVIPTNPPKLHPVKLKKGVGVSFLSTSYLIGDSEHKCSNVIQCLCDEL